MLSISSEHRRKLPTVSVKPGTTVSLPIPTDTNIKRMELRLKGSVKTTYTGSPVASELGYMGRMLNRLQVVADGRNTIKNVQPYMLRMAQLLSKGVAGPRSFGTGASVTSLIGTTERTQGPAFDFPTSGQYLWLQETLEVNFEHPLAYGQGKQASIFSTKSLGSAELIFDFAALSKLQQDGDGVTVTYAEDAFQIEVTLIESPNIEIDPKNPFKFYKETFSVLPIAGPVSDLSWKLTRGNNLTGISFLALNGDTGATLSDKVITRLRTLFNSRNPVQDTSWLELQDDNRIRYGIDGWKSSGNHPQKGFAHMNFMQYGLAGSGLPTQAFNELELRIDTASSSGVDAATYTQSAQLLIMTHELVDQAS